MKLGDLIVQYRQRNDLSQREFARRAELSNSLISILEKGINPQTGKEMMPDIETYSKIAKAMGISVTLLFEKLGDDAAVKLNSFHSDAEPDYEYINTEQSNQSKGNEKVQLFIQDIHRMDPKDIERLIDMSRLMFENSYPDLFKKGSDDENNT